MKDRKIVKGIASLALTGSFIIGVGAVSSVEAQSRDRQRYERREDRRDDRRDDRWDEWKDRRADRMERRQERQELQRIRQLDRQRQLRYQSFNGGRMVGYFDRAGQFHPIGYYDRRNQFWRYQQ